MTGSWLVLGRTADVVTLAAAAIAFYGVVSTLLSRARVALNVQIYGAATLRIDVEHRKGITPVKNVFYNFGGLDETGLARFGDGGGLWAAGLALRESGSIVVFDPIDVSFASEPTGNEFRLPLARPFGLVLDLSWQHPLFPWLRTRRVIVWQQSDRIRGEQPTVLKGLAAWMAYRRAMKSPKAAPVNKD